MPHADVLTTISSFSVRKLKLIKITKRSIYMKSFLFFKVYWFAEQSLKMPYVQISYYE